MKQENMENPGNEKVNVRGLESVKITEYLRQSQL